MKLDKIVDYYGSVIQHGEYNDRVYIIKINPDKYKETLIEAEKLAQKNNYGKIFAKVPFSLGNIFEENPYPARRVSAAARNLQAPESSGIPGGSNPDTYPSLRPESESVPVLKSPENRYKKASERQIR